MTLPEIRSFQLGVQIANLRQDLFKRFCHSIFVTHREKMKNLASAAILYFCSLLTSSAFAQCKLNLSGYQLVWQEEFNSLQSAQTNFDFYCPDPTWNGQNEYYDPSQVSVANGVCTLKATRLPACSTMFFKGKWSCIEYKSGMIASKLGPDNPSGSWQDPRCRIGYGILEIRAKIPGGRNYPPYTDGSAWDTWPALWLYSGPAEIDIIDNQYENPNKYVMPGAIRWEAYPDRNNSGWNLITRIPIGSTYSDFNPNIPYPSGAYVSYNGNYYVAVGDKKAVSIGQTFNSDGVDLYQDFHKYAIAWTPSKITFFFDDRELYTLSDNNFHISNASAYLRANLQIYNSAEDAEYNMYVDYVRMYKPLNGNYSTTSYKSTYEGMNHNLMSEANNLNTMVSSVQGSILINPNNSNEVFYVDQNNRIQCYKINGSNRLITRLEYNDGALPSNANIESNLAYLPVHDIVVYKGMDNRIQYFGRSSIEPCGWYHWYIDDNWSSSSDLGNSIYTKIVTSSNGDIFYVGNDNLIHKFSWNGNDWVGSIVSSSYNSVYPVKGDFTYNNGSNSFTYCGSDDKIHVLYSSGNNYYRYDVGMLAPQVNVASRPNVLLTANAGNDIYFIGQDDKLHSFKYSNGSWSYSLIPYQYDNTGYPQADRLLNGLCWQAGQNRVIYVGKDGRLQALDLSTGSWNHFWVDDYWNTNGFRCNNSTEYQSNVSPPLRPILNSYPFNNLSQLNASLILDNSGFSYYRGKDGFLHCFKWESCEVLNPGDQTLTQLRKLAPDGGTEVRNIVIDTLSAIQHLGTIPELFPNPADEFITIRKSGLNSYIIVDIYGEQIAFGQFVDENKISVASLSKGMYYIQLRNNDIKYQIKFIKY